MKNTVVAAVNHSVGDACGAAALKHEYEKLFISRAYIIFVCKRRLILAGAVHTATGRKRF